MKLVSKKFKSKYLITMPLLCCAAIIPSSLHAEVIEKNTNGNWQSVAKETDGNIGNSGEIARTVSNKTPLKLLATDKTGQEFSIATKQVVSDQPVQMDKLKFKQAVVFHDIEQFDIAQTVDISQQVEIIGLNIDSNQTQKLAVKSTTNTAKTSRNSSNNIRKKSRSTPRYKKQRVAQKSVSNTSNKVLSSSRTANNKIFSNTIFQAMDLNPSAAYRRSIVQPIILAAARQYDVDANLVDAMMWQESRYRDNAQSHVGAIGLMQLMPATARGLGVNPYDNWQNVFGGVAYLRKQLNRFNGNVSLALAAYNAGPGAVRRYRGIPPYRETRNYVKSILARYNSIQLNIVNELLNSGVAVNTKLTKPRKALKSNISFAELNRAFKISIDINNIDNHRNQRTPNRKEKDNHIKFAMNRSEQIINLPVLPYRKIKS